MVEPTLRSLQDGSSNNGRTSEEVKIAVKVSVAEFLRNLGGSYNLAATISPRVS
jgi:hypothetical protein